MLLFKSKFFLPMILFFLVFISLYFFLSKPVLMKIDGKKYSVYMQELLDKFAQPFSEEQVVTIGQTTDGRPVHAHIYGSGSKISLVMGGIHGDEITSVFLTHAFMDSLKNTPINSSLRLIVLPVANPDALINYARRNVNKVDINRNFPTTNWTNKGLKKNYYPGDSPGSEIETQNLLGLLEQFKPGFIITIHAPLKCVNYDGPALELAEEMSLESGYPVQADLGYATPGSMGTFTGDERQIPTITLELAKHETPANIAANVRGIFAALDYFVHH